MESTDRSKPWCSWLPIVACRNLHPMACEQCGHEFELSDALTHQIREHLKTELQADVVKREADAKRKLNEVKAKEEALAKAKDTL
ncbi:MAG TPA: hypothetical protein VFY06_03150, partial [Verrucomicrobiae bacterium]|nr:hypothetical protein [Verrucomicrobiae bacterium]